MLIWSHLGYAKTSLYSHILRDRSELSSALKHIVAEPDDTLFKVDVKDFSMSGSAPELVHEITTCQHASCLRHILKEQFAQH